MFTLALLSGLSLLATAKKVFEYKKVVPKKMFIQDDVPALKNFLVGEKSIPGITALITKGAEKERYTRVATLVGHAANVVSAAVSGDGRIAVSGAEDVDINVWDVPEQRLIGTLVGHTRTVGSIALSDDGNTAVSGSEDGTIKVWNIQDQSLAHTFAGHTRSVISVALSRDGSAIASVSNDGTLKTWNVQERRLISTIAQNGLVYSAALSHDGQTLVFGSSDGTIRVNNVLDGRLLRTFAGHTNWIRSVVLSNDSNTIFSASDDGTVKVWDIEKGRLVKTYAMGQEARSVVLSRDGRTLVCELLGGKAKVWDVQGQRLVNAHTVRVGWGYVLAVSNDRSIFVSSHYNPTIRVCRKQPGTEMHSLVEDFRQQALRERMLKLLNTDPRSEAEEETLKGLQQQHPDLYLGVVTARYQ